MKFIAMNRKLKNIKNKKNERSIFKIKEITAIFVCVKMSRFGKLLLQSTRFMPFYPHIQWVITFEQFYLSSNNFDMT